MMWRAAAVALAAFSQLAWAAPEPERNYPASVNVGKTVKGPVYADGNNKTLYALSLRWARAKSGVTIAYCAEDCHKIWTPLAAPPDAKPVGDWTIIKGFKGPQWAYQRNPVFTYNPEGPGRIEGDDYDNLWSIIDYAPPKPTLIAPAPVELKVVDGAYVLTDPKGNALFTAAASPSLTPFAAGMASRNIGEWSVLSDGDSAQWAWRGQPVYVSNGDDLPANAKVLRP